MIELNKIPSSEVAELKRIIKFVSRCSVEAAALIVTEILAYDPICVHDITSGKILEVEEEDL
jgi:hypothetical protein